MQFNPEQLEAIAHGDGPVIVAAPAGSGKTSCFVQRLARLVNSQNRGKVLGITYTKFAAQNMRERVEKLVPVELHPDLNISTIHSLCWSILKDADVDLAMAMQAQAFLLPPYAPRSILERYTTDRNVKLSALTSAFGLAKNFYVKPEDSLEFFISQGLNEPELLQDAYMFYEQERQQYQDKNFDFVGRYDQDDVLVLTADYLASNEDLRWRWGNRFKYILIDEAQDTSPIQFNILESILEGGEHTNIMLVGDLRQSIYGFRGAFPQYVQEFASKYDARVINLRTNYRSRPEIVAFANAIARNMLDIDEQYRPDMYHQDSYSDL